MLCGRAGRAMATLVRRTLLTLQTNLKPFPAINSNAASSASPAKPAKPSDSCPTSQSNKEKCPDCAPRTPPICCDTAFDFKGKTIIVTGAGKGMGRATANALTACGATVIALESNKEHLDSLARESCFRVVPVHVDLCEWDKTKEVLTPLLQCPIDGVVNNAAVLIKEPFLEMTKEAVQKQLLINVVALLHVGMLAAQNMVQHKRHGSIVNLASISSRKALPNLAAYCTTKGGVAQASRSMAAELGCHGIRVNSVSPTGVLTDMGKKAFENPEDLSNLKERTPLGRTAEVCEVVDVILYLLGDRSTFISGANFPVDGGYWSN